MTRFVRIALSCLVATAVAAPATAQIEKTEAGGMRLVYFQGTESYLVPHVSQACLNSLAFQKRMFDFDPASDPVTILLKDFSDGGDGGASVSPRYCVLVEISPLNYAFETIAANERMILIMNHELVHVATMGRPAGSDRFFRRLFLGSPLTSADNPETAIYGYVTAPRAAAPRWFHEGIAVFSDTWMAGGIGRGQGGWDEMVFRSMVRDKATFYDPLGLASEGTKIDFQLQINAYLYGERFFTWLADRYSPEQVVQWAARKDGSRAYYASQFKQVFGRSIEDAWAEWIAFERAFQQKNLDAIRKYPLTKYRDLSPRALGSVSRAFYDEKGGKLYAGFNYPGVVSHIGAIDIEHGTVQRLTDIKGPAIYTVTSIAWDPATRTVFYTTDNNAYRDIVALDPVTGKRRVLQQDARIGDLAFDRADGSLWGIRHMNGIATIVRVPKPYTQWYQVHSFPYGTVPYDLDVSPDGTRISASFGEVDGQQTVRVLDVEKLAKGDVTPVAQFDFGSAVVPSGFVFSPDGRFLYGTAYQTGVSNIFRYEIATRKIEAVTNTETGFFRPLPLGGDDLIAFRYSGQGFVPVRLTAAPIEDLAPITFLGTKVIEDHPDLKDWNVTTAQKANLDAIPKRTSAYHLAGGLGLESAYPIVQGYKDTQAIGYRINFSDPLTINRLAILASYSPWSSLNDNERAHLRAEYDRYDWRVRAMLNNADFYDLVGPTKVGRKGYTFDVTHKSTLIYDEPRRLDLEVGGNIAGKLDRLPAYQNVPVTVDHMAAVNAKLTWSNLTGSQGKVDDEKGRKGTLAAEVDRVDGKTIGGMYGTFDLGVPALFDHSSVWLRSAAGFSPNDVNNRFANFYFGGFGNNYIDHSTEKRYREFYSFPGVDLNEIGGRNFAKTLLEWNLPPWRYRRVGTPGFYLTWMRPAVFVSGLATNVDAPEIRHVAGNVGGQFDFRFTVLHNLDMTLSIGAALAFERAYAPRREAMVSLRVLK